MSLSVDLEKGSRESRSDKELANSLDGRPLFLHFTNLAIFVNTHQPYGETRAKMEQNQTMTEEGEIKQSHFRLKLGLRYVLPEWLLYGFLAFLFFSSRPKAGIDYGIVEPHFLYSFFLWANNHFLFHVDRVLGFYTSPTFHYALFYLVFIVLPSVLIIKKGISLFKEKFPVVYLPCPECDSSVKVLENWQCEKCYNYQDRETFITEKCRHCKRKLSTVFCEHCHKEIKL